MSRRWVAILPLAIVVTSCDQVDAIRDEFRDLTPYESYVQSLRVAGLGKTALVQAWLEAAAGALSDAPVVGLPYEEEGFFFPDDPGAVGYRLHLRRGQRLTVSFRMEGEFPARVFLEVYRVQQDPGRDPVPVLATDSLLTEVELVAGWEADYIVRIQPELLRGGRYRITLRGGASLTFPVQGKDTRAILSRFGVSREAGRRSHHGVDIFASRGTPVLSASNGRVSRADLTNIGGKVVWVRDSGRSQSIYYAHLDSQVVRRGETVRRGDTLGFVGNTGNARTTPPHLHFSVYARRAGPVDPYYFLYEPGGALPELTASLENVGRWTRTSTAGIRLREGPSSRRRVTRDLTRYTPLLVVAATGSWYRVELPDGTLGFVAARLTEGTDQPLRRGVASAGGLIQSGPRSGAPVTDEVAPGTDLPVLGEFEDFLYVQSPTGRPGWMATPLIEGAGQDR